MRKLQSASLREEEKTKTKTKGHGIEAKLSMLFEFGHYPSHAYIELSRNLVGFEFLSWAVKPGKESKMTRFHEIHLSFPSFARGASRVAEVLEFRSGDSEQVSHQFTSNSAFENTISNHD